MRQEVCINYFRVLLLFLLFTVGGCDVDGDLPPCPWNVRVSYSYAPFGYKMPLKEVLRDLHEYLFDERGVLVGVDMGTKCIAEETDYHLPIGTYTLVAWGNLKDSATPPDYEVGHSTIEELRMQADFEGMGDLMYAAIPFQVAGEGRHTLKAALTDMYASFYINVQWKDKEIPAGHKAWKMELSETPGVYSFRPGTQLQAFEESTALFLPQMPEIETTFTTSAAISDNKVSGTFKTYRINEQSHLIFCLYADGAAMMKKIDLGRLFVEAGLKPEQDRYQQYEIEVIIDGDTVYAMFAVLSGWEEGGAIGGGWGG